MRPLRFVALGSVTGVLTLAVGMSSRPLALAAADVPARLSDREFWGLTESLSEPNGSFLSDNLVSDEMVFKTIVPELRRAIQPGGVYLGVGPEQNFTYLAATRPRMAFILDIRRGNLQLHLMYKALFELSADRADFVARLFTKPRPAGLKAGISAGDLMRAYWDVKTSDTAAYERNLQDIRDVLIQRHGFLLSPQDLKGVAYVYHAFYWYGPSISWSSSGATGSRASPHFADLMGQTDATGTGLSFLADDESFSFVKNLEARNAVVPVVGNFAGPKALRAIGAYVREGQAKISAFYVDEVEPYLVQAGVWGTFCANAATLPIDGSSVFIRPQGASTGLLNVMASAAHLEGIAADTKNCTGRH
jgi:hypothetical protein